MNRPIHFGRAIMTVSGFTALSRISGFIREILTASFLGAGALSDAFFVAFRLPNLFRQLFAEGAFSAAFVPLFNAERNQKDEAAAHRFAADALNAMLWFLCTLVLLMVAGMPLVMRLLAPGFVDTPGTFQLAVGLGQVMFPYLLCVSLVAFFGGIANSYGKFGPFAAAPILFNVGMSGGLIVAHFTDFLTPLGMAIGLVIAGAAQVLWLALTVRGLGLRLEFRAPRLTPEVKKLARLMGPGIIGSGITQILPVVGTIMASTLSVGAVSYLHYADRLYMLPLGIIGAALGTTLLALLSQQISQDQEAEALHATNRGLELALAVGLPSALGFALMGESIVRALFEHGAFTAADTHATADALFSYALALPGIILIRGLSSAFFARQDTATPVKISLLTIVVYTLAALLLIPVQQHVGIASAYAIAGSVNAALLTTILLRRGWLKFDTQFRTTVPRLLLCALLVGVIIYGLNGLCAPWLAGERLVAIPVLLTLIGVSAVAYLALGQALKAFDLRAILALLRAGRTARQNLKTAPPTTD